MKLPIRSSAVAFALICTFTGARAEDAIQLKQHWQTGKRYVQTMDMNQSSRITIGDNTMDQNVTMKSEMSSTITKHEDGKSKRLVMRYERIVMSTEMAGQKMTIDSAQPDGGGSPLGNPFAAFAGKEIRAVLDENDRVKEFENLDEIVSAATAGNPLGGAFFNKSSLTNTIQQSALQALPEKPVKPGDSWPFNVNLPIPQLGNAVIKGTYTFKGIKPRDGIPCAEIAAEGTLTIDLSGGGNAATPESAAISQLGMKIENGSMRGTIWFDNALGTARATELTQEMTISMKSPAAPDQTMSLPMKQVISTNLTKVEDVK